MFICTRRALQRKLDQLQTCLAPIQGVDLAKRLNHAGRDRLAAMWEVLVLSAFQPFGIIEAEPILADGRCPDFKLKPQDLPEIYAEIRTVSDSGLDDGNPVEYLAAEVIRVAKKCELDPRRVRYQVNPRLDAKDTSQNQNILPKRDRISHLVNNEVQRFFKTIDRDATIASSITVTDGPYSFEVSFSPAQMYAGGGYPSYTVAHFTDQNPLWHALQAKKKQLRGAPKEALKMIVICDGGCDLMSRDVIPPMAVGSADIVAAFLDQTTSIDAVLLLTVISKWRPLGEDHRFAASVAFGKTLSLEKSQLLNELVNKAVKNLPMPVHNIPTVSANVDLKLIGQPDVGLDWRPGPSGSVISISSLALHQLLAGKMTFEAFEKLHGWSEAPNHWNLFKLGLSRGEMFVSLNCRMAPNRDDDWVDFTLGPPDPAVSDIRVYRPPDLQVARWRRLLGACLQMIGDQLEEISERLLGVA